MAFIAKSVIEARINNLMRRRERALQHKDYDSVWKIGIKIDKNVKRMISLSYLEFGV